ncbi:Rha family transcriptional regulator [uncultured Butyricimonas sp.]|uniref:Rha family transcriptional regulator n=1 Tax=uncultured Butyricimonas sp. TaxID=1268785 RepID=UPI0026DCD21F|nr:Rha family transcriptional regulator [uncultured Butyricimonas sp.]
MENLILSSNDGRMSSVEIARITEKRHSDVLESIRNMEPAWEKVAERKFPLGSYRDANNQERPCFYLNKTECLYVATKFNDEARAKLILRWEELETKARKPLTSAEMLLQQCQMLVEQERRLKDVEENQKSIEEKVAIIEAKTQTRPNYFTVVGYATLNEIDVTIRLASSLGKKAASLCKKRGIPTEEIPDPRFGKVKTYPESILKEVFDQPLNRSVVKF